MNLWVRALKRFGSSPGALVLVVLSGLFFWAGYWAGVIGMSATLCMVYGFFVMHEMSEELGLSGEEELWWGLEPPVRARLRPLLKLSKEIQGLFYSHRGNPVLSVLGYEMMEQIRSVFRRSVEVGIALRKINRVLQAAPRARAVISDLEAQLRSTQDPVARASLESALASRRQEMMNYERMEALAQRLEAYLHQAEGTLAELRSRVALVATQEASPEVSLEEDSLPGLTERLKTLSATMKESLDALAPINRMTG
ncbi:MAG: hypothetical protein K6T17_04565 [Fimbriimonadales bacterium]|nr:hypothetical protein [Fimbriimonadales bacterium]